MKKSTLTTIDLPKALKKEVQKAAIDADCTLKTYIITALTEKLRKDGGK